jgi:hypothetical protein
VGQRGRNGGSISPEFTVKVVLGIFQENGRLNEKKFTQWIFKEIIVTHEFIACSVLMRVSLRSFY